MSDRLSKFHIQIFPVIKGLKRINTPLVPRQVLAGQLRMDKLCKGVFVFTFMFAGRGCQRIKIRRKKPSSITSPMMNNNQTEPFVCKQRIFLNNIHVTSDLTTDGSLINGTGALSHEKHLIVMYNSHL